MGGQVEILIPDLAGHADRFAFRFHHDIAHGDARITVIELEDEIIALGVQVGQGQVAVPFRRDLAGKLALLFFDNQPREARIIGR